MANPEHLEILKQGVEVWNQWRKNHCHVSVDLSRSNLNSMNLQHADLIFVNLQDVQLQNANLQNADLSFALLQEANLKSSNLRNAKLNYTNLNNADLQETCLIGAELRNAILEKTNLKRADFQSADLGGAKLEKADLREAYMRETILIDTTLKCANLKGSYLVGADLRLTNLKQANLCQANLRLANISGAQLEKAILNETNLSDVSLYAAELQNATIIRCNFSNSDLRGANFFNAILTDSILNNSDLRRVNFSNAILTGVKLYGAVSTDWLINDVKCDHVFFDYEAQKRIPKDRNFEPGEFERRYRSVPTVEMVFENGMNPVVDPIVLAFIAQQIKNERPELGVKLHSIDIKGIYPQAVFGISQERHREEVSKLLIEKYEREIAALKENNDRLFELLKIEMTNKKLAQPGQINFYGDGRYISMSGQAQYNETRIEIQFRQAVEKIRQAVKDAPDETLSKKTSKKILEYLDQAPKTLVGEAAKAGVKKLYGFLSSQNIASIIPKVLPYMDDIKKVFDSLV